MIISLRMKVWSGICLLFLGIAIAGAIWSSLFTSRFVTLNAQKMLQHRLMQTGLNITFTELHLAGWNGFSGSRIVLKDARTGSAILTASRVTVRFDLLSLLGNVRQPESALREILLTRPTFLLKRYPDQTWNINRYFNAKQPPLVIQPRIKIDHGRLRIEDSQFGNHNLKNIDGEISFGQFQRLRWGLKGRIDLDPHCEWSFDGEAVTDRLLGQGVVSLRRAPAPQLLGLLSQAAIRPRGFALPGRITSGLADIQVNLFWNQHGLGLADGKIALNDTTITAPGNKRFLVSKLNAYFSPLRFDLQSARLQYGPSLVRVNGSLNLASKAIRGSLSANRLDLSELTTWIPFLKKSGSDHSLRIGGWADARLDIAGTILKPVVDGTAYFSEASCGWRLNGRVTERISRISGRLSVRHNVLTIQRLEGRWRRSLVGVTGRVVDIFHPEMDLQLFLQDVGTGINPFFEAMAFPLRTDGKVVCSARLRGALHNPYVQGTVTADRVFYQHQTVQHVQAVWGWEPILNRWQIRQISGAIWRGRFRSTGELHGLANGLKWKVSTLLTGIRLEDTPLNTDAAISGSVDADAVLEGVWHPEDVSRQAANEFAALVSFQGKELSCRGITFDEATGIGSYRNGSIKIEALHGKMGEGRIFGSLRWQRDTIGADLDLRNIPLKKMITDARIFSRGEKAEPVTASGIFNGMLRISGNVAEPTAQLVGECTDAVWQDKMIGRLSGGLTYADHRISLQEVTAENNLGTIHITGGLILKPNPTWQLNVSGAGLHMEGLSQWLYAGDPSEPGWKMSGSGDIQTEITGPLEKPVFRGNLQIANLGVANFHIEHAQMEFQGDATGMEINQLQLIDHDSQIEVAGTIQPNHWDLHLSGRAVNLNMFHLASGARNLTGMVDLTAHLTGGPQKPIFDATVEGRNLAFGAWKYDRLSANLSWDGHGIVFHQAKLTQADSEIEINGQVVPAPQPQLNLELAVRSCDIQDILQLAPLPPDIVVTGKTSGLIQVTGAMTKPAIHFTGNMEQAFINSLAVTGYFDLIYQQDQILIQRVELTHEKGLLSARGVWENLQTLKVQAKLTNFPARALGSLIKTPTGQSIALDGTVNSNFNLELSAVKTFGAFQAEIKDCVIGDTKFGNFETEGEFSDSGLTVDSGQFTFKGGLLSVSGYLPWPKELLAKVSRRVPSDTAQNMKLTVAFKNIPAQFVNGFQKQCAFSEGELNGKIIVSGDLTAPVCNGQLNGNNLQFQTEALPLPVENFQAALTIRNNLVQVNKAAGNYGQGKFSVNGTISGFNAGVIGYNLELTGNKLYYKNSFFDGFGDVNLVLSGTSLHPALVGTMTAYNGKIGVLGIASSEDSRKLNPDLDLQLTAGENIRFRQPGLADITMKGALRVTGSLLQPIVDGSLSATQGMITFYGRTFKVNRAKAVFSGSKGFAPTIDLESSLITSTAASSINQENAGETEVEVFLNISGQVGSERNLNITLRSQPYLSQSKIYALLNWPDFSNWSNSGGTGSDQPLTVSGVVTGNISFLTDTMFGDLFYELRRALNVDYLYLEQNYQTNDFRINIGNKLNDRVFLSYSRSFTEYPSDNLNINYYLNQNWNLGGTFNQDYGASWRLLFQINF